MTVDELADLLRAAGLPVRPSGLMRAAELQRYLGVSPRTLRYWRAQHKPPQPVRLNGSWHYAFGEVAQFLAANTGKERQPAVDAPVPSRQHRGTS